MRHTKVTLFLFGFTLGRSRYLVQSSLNQAEVECDFSPTNLFYNITRTNNPVERNYVYVMPKA